MKLVNKLKDRYNILLIILASIFLIIVFRLATITIVDGDSYRLKADTNRIKEVPIPAPRGEIRDRYGRLLAGNRPSFTVQIMKDELDRKERNDVALNLITLLEEEGESYEDEFPILFNKIEFADDEMYDKDIEKEISNLIINNNLIDDLLDLYYYHKIEDNEFEFIVAKKVVISLENEGINVPFIIDINKNMEVEIRYDESQDIDKWKKKNNISLNTEPKDALKYLIRINKSVIEQILNHPIVRELTYEMLQKNALSDDFILNRYSYKFDDKYKEVKTSLIQKGIDGIDVNTTAKEDFISIIKKSCIEDLLTNIYDNDIIIGDMIIKKLEGKEINMPVTYNIQSNEVIYSYKDEHSEMTKNIKENLKSEELSTDAINALIYIADKEGVISEVLTDEKVKCIAQQEMLAQGINPHITVSKWEYASVINKHTWLSSYGIDLKADAKTAFEELRNLYEISDDLQIYEAKCVLSVIQQLKKKGYKAFEPVNIAKDIKNSTVAKIMENYLELPGVKVAVEPIRYYPMGKTASHILGYLGKISQNSEIIKYIEELKYSPNDIIGKTGVEQKFEEYLKGIDGSKMVEVDVFGNILNTLNEKKVIPGDSLYLTIDAKLQKVSEDALKHALEQIQIAGEFKSKWGNYNYKPESNDRLLKNATSGSTVAIDVKTGEVLALANYPSYDPNLFTTGISADDWESLMPENEDDPLAPRPLYNIALKTQIQPGSIFKMITGLAGLEKGLDPNLKIRDMGYIEVGRNKKRYGCWIWNSYGSTHGLENFKDAIRDSCNYYFYTLVEGYNKRTGKDIGVKVNIEDIINMAERFGLDDPTGIEIDIPKEKSGGVPNIDTKVRNKERELRKYLDNNIHKYVKENIKLNDEDLQSSIKEILSWLRYDEILTRGEVIKKLDKLEFDGLRKLEGDRVSLADTIKYDYLNFAHWVEGDILNLAIGQGDSLYTPIQIANYISTLSNGGYKHKVSVIDNIKNYLGQDIGYKKNDNIEFVEIKDKNGNIKTKEFLDIVKDGMYEAAVDGTARRIFEDFPIKVGVKTGTAENGIYDNYAWFVAFAPKDDPQIAVATVLFQGGHGGYAGPVAREMIAQYLGLNSKENNMNFKNKLVE